MHNELLTNGKRVASISLGLVGSGESRSDQAHGKKLPFVTFPFMDVSESSCYDCRAYIKPAQPSTDFQTTFLCAFQSGRLHRHREAD